MPQIQIMQTDLPHTLYKRIGKKGKSGSKTFRFDPEDPAIRLQMEANRRKKERMEREGKNVQYTMDEIFNRD